MNANHATWVYVSIRALKSITHTRISNNNTEGIKGLLRVEAVTVKVIK